MSPRDWDKELAKIDRKMETVSDEQLFPTPKAATPGAAAAVTTKRGRTASFGVMARLVLAVALGVAMLFWPYDARCGLGLMAYLGAVLVVAGSGIWTAVWTWRHRVGRAHVLSLLILLWGMVLAAVEVLPRAGYAKPDAGRPATWMCE